jgi:glycosyltransferase involved in cell wall biosynthesis
MAISVGEAPLLSDPATLLDIDVADTGPVAPVDPAVRRVERALDALESVNLQADAVAALNLSVVIPCYNERSTIREVVRRVQRLGLHREIIVVDDASDDGTADVLDELAESADVRVFRHLENRGKGAALRTAFRAARGEVVLIQDADLEYDPAEYPRLLAPIERGEADVVYGSRYLENSRQDPSWLHRAGNRLLTAGSNWLTGQRLTDMETCYKVFRRELLDDLPLCQNRFGFEPELTAKLARRGVRIHEVPIRYRSRGYEEGKKIGLRDGFNALYCIVRYAWAD